MDKKSATILIVSALIFILSIGVIYFLIMPAYKQAGEQGNQIIQLKAQIDAKNNYYAVIESKMTALEDAGWAEKRKSIEVNFTSSPFFIPKINTFFQALVSGSGMTLSSLTGSPAVSAKSAPQAQSSGEVKISKDSSTQEKAAEQPVATTYFDQLQGPVNKVSFNIAVNGTYSAFKKLLSDLEGQTRIVTIKNIAVSSSSQQGSGKKITNTSLYNLTVDVYSY